MKDIQRIFDKTRRGIMPENHEVLQYRSAMLIELAKMDAEKG